MTSSINVTASSPIKLPAVPPTRNLVEGISEECSASDIMNVVQAVQAMNRAQTVWSKRTSDERVQAVALLLSDFETRITAHQDQLAQTLALSMGMPIRRAKEVSVPTAIAILRDTKVRVQTTLANGPRFSGAGNTAVLLGWTDPLIQFMRRVPVVTAAGNSVLVKPSSLNGQIVDFVAGLWLESLNAAKMPPGFISVLHGKGAGEDSVGDLILRHPAFKTIYWIGRTDGALEARAIANANGKRFFFEGSGRNSAILFDGFDDKSFEAHLRNFAHAVRDPHCLGPFRPSRFFIQESIYKRALDFLAEEFRSAKSGDVLDLATDVGPLPEREILKFENQTRLALGETGRLVAGGTRDGANIQPTLIRDLTNCSTLQSEELAGPWATAASFKYQHEALKYANTSPLGLAAFVLHPDGLLKARSVAEKIEASRIIFESSPDWSKIFTLAAPPVKNSSNHVDGTDAVFESARWSSVFIS